MNFSTIGNKITGTRKTSEIVYQRFIGKTPLSTELDASQRIAQGRKLRV